MRERPRPAIQAVHTRVDQAGLAEPRVAGSVAACRIGAGFISLAGLLAACRLDSVTAGYVHPARKQPWARLAARVRCPSRFPTDSFRRESHS